MNEDKRIGGMGSSFQRNAEEAEDKQKNPTASRARNKTVMLTAEMTGQVRKLLDHEGEEVRRDPLTDLLPPTDWTKVQSNGPSVTDPDLSKAVSSFNSGSSEAPPIAEPPVESKSEPRSAKSTTGKLAREQLSEAFVEAPPAFGANTGAGAASGFDRLKGSGQPGFSLNTGVGTSRPSAPAVAPSGSAVTPNRSPAPPLPTRPVIGEAGGRTAIQASPAKTSTAKLVGFLVSFDNDKNGEVFELRVGRWLLTSRPTDHGDYLLIDDRSISPLHAILRATKDGKLQVLDQLSEFGTGIIRNGKDTEEEVAGTMMAVEHGDTLRFGERHFAVSLIPQVRQKK